MAGENLAGLPDGDVEQRAIPIAEVGGHAHGRGEGAAGLFDGGGGTAHGHGPDIEIFADQGNLVSDGVVDGDAQVLSVKPAFGFAALDAARFFHGVGERAEQHVVVIGEPAGGAFGEQALHHDGREVEFVSEAAGGGGVFSDGAAYVLIRKGDEERRGQILIHLTVPFAQQGDGIIQRRVVGVAPLIGVHDLAGEEMAEGRVHVLLHSQHVRRPPAFVGGEHRADLHEALRRREVAVYGVREILREGILVGGDDHAAGRVVDAGELLEGNIAIPFEVARGAIHRDIAAIVAAPG